MTGGAKNATVLAVRGSLRQRREDFIAVERALEIRVGGEPLVVTMRTPGHDADLAVGFLFTEGLIRAPSDVARVETLADDVVAVELAAGVAPPTRDRRFAMTSACGVCGKITADTLRAEPAAPLAPSRALFDTMRIHAVAAALLAAQSTFAATGGLHAAGLFDEPGTLAIAREDVGRHNAVDKVLGARMRTGDPFAPDGLLVVSGRASFELVSKALMARIPVLAAVGAPSSAAVELARSSNMTLLGFVRDDRFNVYSGEGRLA